MMPLILLVVDLVLPSSTVTLTLAQALPTGGANCRVTICSPSLKDLGYEPNEPNTMNLERVGERAGFLANGPTSSKDLKDKQTKKNTDKT